MSTTVASKITVNKFVSSLNKFYKFTQQVVVTLNEIVNKIHLIVHPRPSHQGNGTCRYTLDTFPVPLNKLPRVSLTIWDIPNDMSSLTYVERYPRLPLASNVTMNKYP